MEQCVNLSRWTIDKQFLLSRLTWHPSSNTLFFQFSSSSPAFPSFFSFFFAFFFFFFFFFVVVFLFVFFTFVQRFLVVASLAAPSFLFRRQPNKRSLQVSYLIKLRETAGNEFRYPDAFRPRQRDTSWPAPSAGVCTFTTLTRRETPALWLNWSQWRESASCLTPSVTRASGNGSFPFLSVHTEEMIVRGEVSTA